jgi:hypothetical protein
MIFTLLRIFLFQLRIVAEYALFIEREPPR